MYYEEKNNKCSEVKWSMNLYSKMFADVHDLLCFKKSDSRSYKVSPNTDVFAAEIGQICWLIVDLYI